MNTLSLLVEAVAGQKLHLFLLGKMAVEEVLVGLELALDIQSLRVLLTQLLLVLVVLVVLVQTQGQGLTALTLFSVTLRSTAV